MVEVRSIEEMAENVARRAMQKLSDNGVLVGRWITVSERLPEEFADVLCGTNSDEIFIATYLGEMNDGTICFDDHDGMMWEGDVITWMPLPEPYRGGGEKE